MGTCNFWTLDDFSLMVMDDEAIVKRYFDDEECDEFLSSIVWDYLEEDFNSMVEELNDKLIWYEPLELKSGYYSGVQIYTDSKYINIDNWTEEDAQDEFGLTLEELKATIENEKMLISNFLSSESKQLGFEEIICLGVFNNGEAIYKRI